LEGDEKPQQESQPIPLVSGREIDAWIAGKLKRIIGVVSGFPDDESAESRKCLL